ncbi:dbda3107-72ad-41c9-b189-97450e35555f [Thermothielavioides terrestris]|uniref:Nuclear transport factor 2 n=2 Tax=Thermothielavioides terrestris TaxID=2587410 RepID=G2QS74_THETT|nr:uncharacterized protein THITE_2169643 [Thermothielavioides terrestris NRRL 8126]AEO64263.1 hypothetical protein THITE_2169643 [Thermothielavioides terrestris NRRL 8126]SPQ26890.1 dbda3107-72ad-41c9-b189-97450e35555f [Thermothielavioides terrestris]
MAVDFQSIAKQFVEHYYATFDSNRTGLLPLYRENSMLTFQDAQHLGAQSIVEKLASLSFQKVTHKVSGLDAQPTPNGGIIILVTGQLVVDEEEHPLTFSQAFQLCQDPNGQWFVFNDIFRLALP